MRFDKTLLSLVILLKLVVSGLGTAHAAECRHINSVNDATSNTQAVFALVKKEAYSGDTACKRLLGSMYGFAIGVTANETAARRWKFVASLLGDRSAVPQLIQAFGSRDSMYDPVMAYAITRDPSNKPNHEITAFWAKGLSAAELEEANVIANLLYQARQ